MDSIKTSDDTLSLAESYEIAKRDFMETLSQEVYDEDGVLTPKEVRIDKRDQALIELATKFNSKKTLTAMLPKLQINSYIRVLYGQSEILKTLHKYRVEDMRRITKQNALRNINNFLVEVAKHLDELFEVLTGIPKEDQKVQKDLIRELSNGKDGGDDNDENNNNPFDRKDGPDKPHIPPHAGTLKLTEREKLDVANLESDCTELQHGISQMRHLKSRNMEGTISIKLHYDYSRPSRYKDFPAVAAVAMSLNGATNTVTIDLRNKNVTLYKTFQSLGASSLT